MGKIFTKRYLLVGCVCGCMVLAHANGLLRAVADPTGSPTKWTVEAFPNTTLEGKGRNTDPPTYSKTGSDSISLVIFGKVLAPKVVPTASGAKSSSTSSAEDKSKKKDKFSIKSSDKLKTNHSLY